MVGGPRYWPPGVPEEETIDAYVQAYKSIGYAECVDGTFKSGWEKVALFAQNGIPKHAARQIGADLWTSKLGKAEDISHALNDVSGPHYGNVVRYLSALFLLPSSSRSTASNPLSSVPR